LNIVARKNNLQRECC